MEPTQLNQPGNGPRGTIRRHVGRNEQSEGWMSDCIGGGRITRTEGGKEGWL